MVSARSAIVKLTFVLAAMLATGNSYAERFYASLEIVEVVDLSTDISLGESSDEGCYPSSNQTVADSALCRYLSVDTIDLYSTEATLYVDGERVDFNDSDANTSDYALKAAGELSLILQ